MSIYDEPLVITITVPNTTYGDYMQVKGVLMDAATAFVDWEQLHNHAPDAVSAPGRILMQIAEALPSITVAT